MQKMWYNNIKGGGCMKTNKQLIEEVNGTMRIEGMPLTDDDRNRMQAYLDNPAKYEYIMHDLLKKHTVYVDRV